jgi:hypothetical protein
VGDLCGEETKGRFEGLYNKTRFALGGFPQTRQA